MSILFTKYDLINSINNKNLLEIRQILVNKPSLIEDCDDNNIPIALYCASCGDFNILKYIVEYSRASLNIYDKSNRNILHYGTMSGNLDVCKYLVERCGLSILSYDKNLVTPYDLATENFYENIITYYKSIVGADITNMYKNPIRSGVFPDPSIVRVGDDYYMVNSSFIFFPCIPISHSKDLINWEIIGHAIVEPDWALLSDLEGGRGYWAPDISYCDGIFYITATYRLNDTGTVLRKQIIVNSNKPEGPYSKPVFVEEDGIDPSLFHEDGKHYMLLNRGARIFQIDPISGKILSEPTMLFYGDNKRAPEGPHLLKKDGYYYLLLAEGGTGLGHQITVSRSKTLMGTYEPCPYNPIMTQKDFNAIIQRCGHGKFVKTQNNEWFCVYLCGRTIDGKFSILGRETALDPVTWTKDGWPVVNFLKGPSALQVKPNLNEFKFDKKNQYTLKPLSKNWIFPREPYGDVIKYNGDNILLRGSSHYLSNVNAKNILLQRQTSFEFDFSIKAKLIPLTKNQEYGIIAYYDENTWVSLAITYEDNIFYAQVKEHIGEININHKKIFIEKSINTWIALEMKTSFLTRIFCLDNKVVETLDNVNYLCDEGLKKGKRFTGAMFGLFVYEEKHALYGEFKDFKYNDK